MPAVQQTIEQVKQIEQYKYGFETKIESVKAPKGLDERTVRFISEKKGEPGWMLDWRLEAFRRWMTMQSPASSLLSAGALRAQTGKDGKRPNRRGR